MAAPAEAFRQTTPSTKTARRLPELIDGHGLESAALIPPAKNEETASHWLAKSKLALQGPDGPFPFLETLGFALQLAIFTPSLMGATPVDRPIRRSPAQSSGCGVDARAAARLGRAFAPIRNSEPERPALTR